MTKKFFQVIYQKDVRKLVFLLLFSIILVFAISLPLLPQSTSAYENPLVYFTPAQILRTPIGTRAAGMAAFTGQADDLSAVFYNPAGLSKTNYWEVQLSHRDDLAKVDFDSLVVNIPFSRGSVALYGVFTHVYDYENSYYGVPDNPYKGYKGGYGGVSFGMNILSNILSAGMGIKWLSVQAQDVEYNGLLTDLALQFNYDLSKLRKIWSMFYFFPALSMSIAVMNIHPKTDQAKDFAAGTESINLGISLYYKQILALNVDLLNPLKIGNNHIKVGLEIWPLFFLSLRGGISTEYVSDRFTYFTGFGIGNKLGNNHLSFEYAFEADMLKNNQLERRHQFSIVNSFGGTRYEEKIKDEKPYKMHKLKR